MIWLAWFIYFGISAGVYHGIKYKVEFKNDTVILAVMSLLWPMIVGNILVEATDYFDEKEKN